jgi:hypothetical protein
MPFEAARAGTLLGPQQIDSCLTVLSDTQFWTKTNSTEITPSEGVQSLLNSPSDIARVLNFQGSEAQEFIDFLDQVSWLRSPHHHLATVDGVQKQALLRSNLDKKHWRRCIRLIRKISKALGIIPSSYTVQEEYIHVGNIHYDGRFTELCEGEYQGRTVAIKRLKVDDRDPRKTFKVWSFNLANHPYSGFAQRLCREIIAWKHLTHGNILPLLGVSISTDTHCFRILTEWMPHGNIMRYARTNPAANRLELVSQLAAPPPHLSHREFETSSFLESHAGLPISTTTALSMEISKECVHSLRGTLALIDN